MNWLLKNFHSKYVKQSLTILLLPSNSGQKKDVEQSEKHPLHAPVCVGHPKWCEINLDLEKSTLQPYSKQQLLH